MHNIVKAIAELLPLTIFFIMFKTYSMEYAIASIMICSAISLLIYKFYLRIMPKMFLFTTSIIVLFGGASLYFNDPSFFKIKPTICYTIFAIVMLYDHRVKHKYAIKFVPILGQLGMKHLHTISILWILYSLSCAVLNEMIWRNFSDDIWVNFKVFGLLGMNIILMVISVLFVNKYRNQQRV